MYNTNKYCQVKNCIKACIGEIIKYQDRKCKRHNIVNKSILVGNSKCNVKSPDAFCPGQSSINNDTIVHRQHTVWNTVALKVFGYRNL